MKGSGIVLTGGPGVDVVVAVEGVSACSALVQAKYHMVSWISIPITITE